MRISRLFGCVAVALFIVGCARDPKPGTPEAADVGERYMRAMSDTLASSKVFSFETSERVDVMAPSGQKRTMQFSRKAVVRRPNALFFELYGKGDTALEIDAYYDGRTATLNEREEKVWTQTDVPDNLDQMLDDVARRFGLPVPIGDVIYSSPYDAFIGRTTQGGLVGREVIEGLRCVKLDYEDAYVGVQLWLPESGQPLPRRLEIVYKVAPSLPTAHIDFANWNLNVPPADTTFAFQPADGERQLGFQEFVAGMASGNMPAGQANSLVAPGTAASKPGKR
jgi:hypothetical protein